MSHDQPYSMMTANLVRPVRVRHVSPEGSSNRPDVAATVFDETGGLHAAGLFDRSGVLAVMSEDVGRHNAVDKVVGRMLLDDRLPLRDSLLFVSGRTP